jgi:tetratricopeptide (TPR) repeat protein
MADDRAATDLLADGWEALAEAAFRTGDYADAEAALAAARDAAGRDGDRASEAAALHRLGMLMHFQALDRGVDATFAGDEEALFQRALEIRREIGDLGGVAGSLFGIGLVHQVLRGDWDAAMPYFREALALDEHADLLDRSEVHRHVGFFYLVKEVQPEKAVEHLRISLDLREAYGDPRWTYGGLIALGEAEVEAGRRPEGVAHLRDAVRIAREAGIRADRLARAAETLRQAEAD